MKTADIQELSNFLLDYAAMLMRSGANTERTVKHLDSKIYYAYTLIVILIKQI